MSFSPPDGGYLQPWSAPKQPKSMVNDGEAVTARKWGRAPSENIQIYIKIHSFIVTNITSNLSHYAYLLSLVLPGFAAHMRYSSLSL